MNLKVSVYTLGCKVNQYESRAIFEELERMGLSNAGEGEIADVCIINTCTVTSESDRKSRQTVRRAISENPGALVIVTGCSSQIDPSSFMKIQGVDAVVTNAVKMDVCRIVSEFLETGKRDFSDLVCEKNIENAEFEPMSICQSERTRAYVKIEDGCESKCAYCIIPKARGKIRSKPIQDVLDEVKTLVERGYKEIVLTGIEISAYGKGQNFDLPTLLLELDSPRFAGLERIRLGSLDPSYLTPKTVDALARCKKLTHHFHLSLQSGCDRILNLMRRRYNTKMVLDYVKYIRQVMSDVCFTADVIVGFPGESEEDAAITKAFLEEIELLHCHLFCYSRRPGTEADKMKGQIDASTKTKRLHELSEIVEKTSEKVLSSFIGNEYDVLFEEYENGAMTGHTASFAKVSVNTDRDLRSQILRVKIVKAEKDLLIGQLLPDT